jgi:hypothetical protein
VTVNGSGTYTTPNGYTLPATGSTAVGTYQWNVSYSGDANNTAASENGNAAERVTVGMATPSVTVNLSSAKDASEFTGLVTAAANLSGAYSPGGTLTFTLVNVIGFGADGSTAPRATWTVAVNGDGVYNISFSQDDNDR